MAAKIANKYQARTACQNTGLALKHSETRLLIPKKVGAHDL